MDKGLRHQILRAAVRDNMFLREAWQAISPTDFSAREESVIASVAVRFYEKYGEPIGGMLRSAVDIEISKKDNWGEEAKRKLAKLLDKLLGEKMEPVSVKALIDQTRELKRSSFYEKAVEEIITAQEGDELTPDKLSELVTRANQELSTEPVLAHDYFDEPIRERNKRRRVVDYSSFPILFIEPLDNQIHIIGPGHFGMIMAPPGGGKGLSFVKIDIAYALQGLKVLHFTLEDPIDLVENRLDSCLTGIPLTRLAGKQKTVRKIYEKKLKSIRGKLRIVDATDGTWTVSKIERVVDQFKQAGFDADAILIDYDDEIVCEKQFKGESARRFEFAEIYRRLRKMAKDRNKIVWIAAQTTRQAVGEKVISAKHVAEDYSKIRKVFFAMAIGSDKKRPDIKYLNIIKHRAGKANFGVHIVSRYKCAMLYDERATDLYYQSKDK